MPFDLLSVLTAFGCFFPQLPVVFKRHGGVKTTGKPGVDRVLKIPR